MIEAKEIKNKKNWDGFVSSQPFYTFLQSWDWGEFNQLMGDDVIRVGFFDADKLMGVSQWVLVHARARTFLFCPHGPLLDWENTALVKAFFKNAKELAVREKSLFIRISPALTEEAREKKHLAINGFRDAPIHMHAEASWLLDISKSEDDILAGMRKTTRYLVRKGITEGVKVEIRGDEAAMDIFSKMHQGHARRHGYVAFTPEYLKNEWKAFSKDDYIRVLLATFNRELLAAAVIIYFGKWGFYYQAASNDMSSRAPASYAILWQAIKEAKRRGLTNFNFWGIAPEDKPKHPWAGLTLFKQGFGGYRVNLLHAQDYPLSPFYWPIYIFESLRRMKRGL